MTNNSTMIDTQMLLFYGSSTYKKSDMITSAMFCLIILYFIIINCTLYFTPDLLSKLNVRNHKSGK